MRGLQVVCHMMGSVDGRILTERWSLSAAGEAQYEAVHALHRADAWMCGRRTFQFDFQDQKRDAVYGRKGKVPPGDFISEYGGATKRGKAKKPVYAIAVDPSGKVRWESNKMRGDRLVVLTTSRAPLGYLADLRAKSISYLIGGRSTIDFASVLVRLHRLFGIRKLMLEGGGSINGALLAAGLVDELSLLNFPFADGAPGEPTVFDIAKDVVDEKATALQLISAKIRPGDVVWLLYRVRARNHRARRVSLASAS